MPSSGGRNRECRSRSEQLSSPGPSAWGWPGRPFLDDADDSVRTEDAVNALLAQPKVRRFRFLRDPLFLSVVALYLLNRFVIKPGTGNSNDFFHRWLNDLICVAFWLPPILGTLRLIGLRDHDAPPTWPEIICLVVSWSFVFELLLPEFPSLHRAFPHAVSDPFDVFFYVVGGLAAGLIWRSGETPPLPAGPRQSDGWQHCRWALGIAITTIVGVLAVAIPNQSRSQYHVQRKRGYL